MRVIFHHQIHLLFEVFWPYQGDICLKKWPYSRVFFGTRTRVALVFSRDQKLATLAPPVSSHDTKTNLFSLATRPGTNNSPAYLSWRKTRTRPFPQSTPLIQQPARTTPHETQTPTSSLSRFSSTQPLSSPDGSEFRCNPTRAHLNDREHQPERQYDPRAASGGSLRSGGTACKHSAAGDADVPEPPVLAQKRQQPTAWSTPFGRPQAA